LGFIMFKPNNKTGAIDRNNIFEITWQGLILHNISYYLKLLEVCHFYIDWFRRVDICLDLKVNTDYLNKNILFPLITKRKKDITCTPYITKGKWDWLGVWEKNPYINTWKYIRVYNKILDTYGEKEKWFLYKYKDEWIIDLSRIELELRRDKCKHFHVEYLTDIDKLYSIFKHEVYCLNPQFFKFIHLEDAKKVANVNFWDILDNWTGFNLTKGLEKKNMVKKLNKIIMYWSEFRDIKEQARTITIMQNSIKKLYINGFSMPDLIDKMFNVLYELKIKNVCELILKTKNRLKEVVIHTS
jgi:hypothetical protein